MIEDKSFVAERRILYDWSSSSDHLKTLNNGWDYFAAVNVLVEVPLVIVIFVQHLLIFIVSASGIILGKN
jgi:hypothetical protein